MGHSDTSLAAASRKRRAGGRKAAWRLVCAWLALTAATAFAQAPDLAAVEAIYARIGALYQGRRHAETEPLHHAGIEALERALGVDHPDVAIGLDYLAALYRGLGRAAEAEPLYRRALALRERAFGTASADVATSLDNLADLYAAQQRHGEAAAMLERALAIRAALLGDDHLDTAASRNALAFAYRDLGRLAEADALLARALATLEGAVDSADPRLATTINNLALIRRERGDLAGAEPLYRRALAIFEQTQGAEHPDVAQILDNLSALLSALGRDGDAQPLAERALATREKAFGPDHATTALSLNALALLAERRGDAAEAEALFKRVLAIREQALGLDHLLVAGSLDNLADLYRAQGRPATAEPLVRRALAIRERVLGPDHPEIAIALNNLAVVLRDLGREAEAAPLLERSLTLLEAALGPDHPRIAVTLGNLAAALDAHGRHDEAEALHLRALGIRQQRLGPDHPDIATTLNNLGAVQAAQGRYAAAEAAHRRALAIREAALGPDHPLVAASLANLAAVLRLQQRYVAALDTIERATGILAARAQAGAEAERRARRSAFLSHVALAEQVARDRPAERERLAAEAFAVGQLAQSAGAAQAVARMAARFAAGDDALAAAIRERQDIEERRQHADATLLTAVSQPPERRGAPAEAALRAELVALGRRVSELDARLGRDFPRYAEIASPPPLRLDEAQALLGPDEALVVWLVDAEDTFIWAVHGGRAVLARGDLGRQALAEKIMALRGALDPAGRRIERASQVPRFRAAIAFELYRDLLGPIEAVLAGARHVFIVPDGPLQSLPPAVLVTAEPEGSHGDFSLYRNAAWLARRHALTVLPSVSALRALRGQARPSQARLAFLGIGDPALGGSGDTVTRGGDTAGLFRGAQADVAAVFRLPPLPDSAGELRAMAQALGGAEAAVLTRDHAIESALRAAPLGDYRVLAFATHGLVAGELKGLAEPALVLTPPAVASPDDDGLLTASEIAQLRLDADWVVLSACNTAAGDGTPGAEGLSGLAKAFFYAGSRALLVSHWQVFSDAAVRLTTGAFDALAKEPGIGRAEALRRAMAQLASDPDNPHFAHPMFWAPFVVVGEGGPGR